MRAFTKQFLVAVVAVLTLAVVTPGALAQTQAPTGAPVQVSLLPSTTNALVGEVNQSNIWVDTGGTTINAADITVTVDPSLATIVGAEHSNSIFNLWVKEPEIIATDGTAQFTGGTTTPFSGKGIIGQVYWQAVKPGTLSVALSKDSVVLLNDGEGTKVPIQFSAPTYTIASAAGLPVVTSTSHPDQNQWYQTSVAHFNWDVVPGAEYSYVVTHDPNQEPDQTPDTPVGNIQLSPLPDGVYYFRLRQELKGQPWSATVTRQFKIDATPPDPFVVRISQDAALFNGQPFASFIATDALSGVVSYRIQEGNLPPQTIAAPPYVLKDASRSMPVTVTAIDRAGNERTVVVPAEQASVLTLRFILVLLILVLAALWLVRQHRSRR